MRRQRPSVQLLLNLLHLPLSTSYIVPTPPAIVVRNPTFPEPTPPPPAQALAQNPSCALLSQALSICAVLTPGFVTLLPPAQAHCLCYSSTVWAPKVLDDAVKTCADYASTAAPGAFGPLLNLEGFCMSMGDVGKDAPMGVPASTTAGNGTNGGITASNYVPHASPTTMISYGGAGNGVGNNAGQSGGQGGSSDRSFGAGNNNGLETGGSRGIVGNPASTTTSAVTSGSSGSSSSGLPGMTITHSPTRADITITVNGAGATQTGDGAVRNRGEVTEEQVVLVSLAIAILILFL